MAVVAKNGGVQRACRTLLTAVCALYLSGAHWAVLQMTAWTGMLVTRAQTVGVGQAVLTTFDGAHPCHLCSAITSGQQEEKKEVPVAPVVKKLLEFKSATLVRFELAPPLESAEIAWNEFRVEDGRRLDAPPTPPPLA